MKPLYLVPCPAEIHLCTKEKQFKKLLKRIEYPYDEPWMGGGEFDALTHTFSCDNALMCIVCMPVTAREPRLPAYGLLVHEAMHVWRKIRKRMGEESPSSEFEAYSMQTISQLLFQQYEDALEKCQK